MKLRPYTSDDYVNGTMCIHMWSGKMQTVFPFMLGGKHPFHGGRTLCFKYGNGYTTSRNIDSGELTTSLYAAVQAR